MQPADSIIKKLGGDTAVARIVGVHRTRVANWKRPKEAGGSGGRIPQGHVETLIDYARANDIALTHADFFGAGAGAETQGAS